MTTTLRIRLFLSFLLILLISMGAAGLLIWGAVERLYLQTQQENLLAQAELLADSLQGQPLAAIPAEPYNQTLNVQPGIHTRIITEQGAVILGMAVLEDFTQLQMPAAENNALISPDALLERPEIAQALQGQTTAAIRRVASANNHRVLYAAAPIFSLDGTITGLVYLATPLPAGGLPPTFLAGFAGIIAATAGLALAAGTWLAQGIARPVENIAQAAGAVSAGDMHQQVPANSRIRELDRLGETFNTMTNSLRQSDHAKNAFVANVTHELRTPLTVIKGTIETLEDGALDDLEGRGPLLASMHRETERLIRLVKDLLVLTRADAGALKMDIYPVNLNKLVQTRCEQMAALATRRRIRIHTVTEQPERAYWVMGDPDRLAEVVDNLLDNAIRYSPDGATVMVHMTQKGNSCACGVSDCGPGIPEQHLPYIFERFYRADTSRSRQTGGAGLGLSIARALVVAHGGHISAESTPGMGTTLRFWIPAATNVTKLPEN